MIPFVLLFFAIFCSISYLQTGTFDYGLSRPLAKQGISFKALSTRFNRARIAVQEFIGLRAPRIRKAKAKPNAVSYTHLTLPTT